MADPKWDGVDRRKPQNMQDPIELAHIYYRLEKLESSVEELTPKIDELVSLLDKSKGGMWVLTKVIAVAVGVWAFVQWSKDHIKF